MDHINAKKSINDTTSIAVELAFPSPGWVMRLYFDLDKADPIHDALCKLACSDTNLDICDAANLPGTPMKDATKVFAMNWRFFPTLDPQVSSSPTFGTSIPKRLLNKYYQHPPFKLVCYVGALLTRAGLKVQ